MINFILFILLFVLCYLRVYDFFINQQVNRFQKRNSVQANSKENSYKKLFSKINFIKTKENFLFLQGYPLKLNAISYYLLKISLSILFFISGLINYGSTIAAVILACLGFFSIDMYIAIYKKNRDNDICNDLLNVTDSITMQLASFVPLKDSLKKQYENCKNKDFKKALMMFSTKYELSELNVDYALNDLSSKFDILEVDMFCNTIKQYNKVGNIIELLENLSSILKEKYINKLKSKTREKILYITFGVIISLGNIILLIFYPLFTSIGNSFNQIFK